MDMSDAQRASARPGALPAGASTSTQAPARTPPHPETERWRDLVDGVGREIAGPLTSALERVHALTTTGRIDKAGLRALRDEISAARNAGMIAQQLSRLATDRLRISHERLSLSQMLGEVVTHRRREVEARGLKVEAVLKPADVLADASLLFSLLNSLLDWAMVHAQSAIGFSIDLRAWPGVARLACRFEHHFPHEAPVGHLSEGLDSLTWRLVEQTATTLGLGLSRTLDNGDVAVTVEFTRTVEDPPAGLTVHESNDGFALSTNSRPLAGSQVLVIASRRELRMRVRDAIHHMGLALDLVKSVEEAIDFCREGLPHAIIVEGILRGEKLNQLRREIYAEVPDFAFIEIIEEGSAFEMSGTGTASMGRVGRDAIESALPSVLMFELSKTG